jgi:hypothetical protein
MKYFNSLPLIETKDQHNNNIVVNNLLSRAYFLPSLVNNISLFYNYTLNDGDTPEMLAHKYYGNVYRYWMVLFANAIIDPQSEWPLSSQQMTLYLEDKYKDLAGEGVDVIPFISSTPHHFEKVITTTNNQDLQSVTISVTIDLETYNNMLDIQDHNKYFPNGDSVYQVITKKAVSIYDYEIDKNEKKRNINLIKNIYATDAERQFLRVMNTGDMVF